jgi:hypothetical protein
MVENDDVPTFQAIQNKFSGDDNHKIPILKVRGHRIASYFEYLEHIKNLAKAFAFARFS